MSWCDNEKHWTQIFVKGARQDVQFSTLPGSQLDLSVGVMRSMIANCQVKAFMERVLRLVTGTSCPATWQGLKWLHGGRPEGTLTYTKNHMKSPHIHKESGDMIHITAAVYYNDKRIRSAASQQLSQQTCLRRLGEETESSAVER